MIRWIEVAGGYQLEDYARHVGLAEAVAALRVAGDSAAAALRGRRVVMLSSTASGGGVAEMLPREVSLLRQLGLDVRWAVFETADAAFWSLTKRLHNSLHGVPERPPDREDAARYAAVSAAIAAELGSQLAAGDVLVVHDPQPLAAGALLAREVGLRAVWRCHIGLDRETPATRAAWAFLAPWTEPYARTVFSLPAYVPPFLRARATILTPAIDPLSHKNRELSIHKLTGVLRAAALLDSVHPPLLPPFGAPALRLVEPETWVPARAAGDLGLLFRPIVLQVSRWDRLKGFAQLLDAFATLKTGHAGASAAPRLRETLAASRLVLAGPDPAGVADDPESRATLAELAERWAALPPALRADVALLVLPMGSTKENALVVNALQRCATVVVQNSLEEGFGLTATEAMWKARAVLAGPAAGLRAQITDGVTGRIARDARDPAGIAASLGELLATPKARELLGLNARAHVATELVLPRVLAGWLQLLAAVAG